MKTLQTPQHVSANDRGHANHGWLESYHTFSFASYHNPDRMGFGLLRVFNDDTVAPAMGFGKHPHDNMEIVSIPLSGALRHRDSTGREEVIHTGDVQIMSAGTGIEHSEMNASREEAVKFLQIWVYPKKRDIAPRYEQITFSAAGRQNQFQTVVSPTEDDGAVWINQDAWFSLAKLEAGKSAEYTRNLAGNGLWAFVIAGEVRINGQALSTRDSLGLADTDTVNVEASADAEVLLIEVPLDFNHA